MTKQEQAAEAARLVAEALSKGKAVTKVAEGVSAGFTPQQYRAAARGETRLSGNGAYLASENHAERMMELSREHAHVGDRDGAVYYAGKLRA